MANTFPYPSSGNLGLGTTTPAELLDVAGNIQIGTSAALKSAGGRIDIQPASGQVALYDGSSSYYFEVYNGGTANARIQGSGDSWLGAISGNIGIGTTSPAAKLNVVGGVILDGGLSTRVSAISTNTTLDATYHTVFVTSIGTGTVTTVTLPTASAHPGREYRIKNKGAGKVEINGTIDGKSGGLRLNVRFFADFRGRNYDIAGTRSSFPQ